MRRSHLVGALRASLQDGDAVAGEAVHEDHDRQGRVDSINPFCGAGSSEVNASGQVIQLGALSILTYAVELLLERGVVHTIGTLVAQLFQGAFQGLGV